MTIWKDVILKYQNCEMYFDTGVIYRARCFNETAIPVFQKSQETFQTCFDSTIKLSFVVNSYFGPFLYEQLFEAKKDQFCSVRNEEVIAYTSFEALLIAACAGSNHAGLIAPALLGFGGRYSKNDCSGLAGFVCGSLSGPEQISDASSLVFRFWNTTNRIDLMIEPRSLIVHRVAMTSWSNSGVEHVQYCYHQPVFGNPNTVLEGFLSERFGAAEQRLYQLNSSEPATKAQNELGGHHQIRLLIVEPHNLLRAGLESAFRKCSLVQSYGEIDSILDESQQSISSVMIVNVKSLFPSLSANVLKIRAKYPDIKILIIGETFTITGHCRELQRLGVNAICLLDCLYSDLLNALNLITGNSCYLDPRLKEIMDHVPKIQSKLRLTEPEIDVLRRIQMRESDLCTELGLDRQKLGRIKDKLLAKLKAGSTTRAGLVAEAMGYVLLPVLPELDPDSGFTVELKNAMLAAQLELDCN